MQNEESLVIGHWVRAFFPSPQFESERGDVVLRPTAFTLCPPPDALCSPPFARELNIACWILPFGLAKYCAETIPFSSANFAFFILHYSLIILPI